MFVWRNYTEASGGWCEEVICVILRNWKTGSLVVGDEEEEDKDWIVVIQSVGRTTLNSLKSMWIKFDGISCEMGI